MSRLTANGTVVASTTISTVLALCLLGGLGAEAPAAASVADSSSTAMTVANASASSDIVSVIDQGFANGTHAGAFFGASGGLTKALDAQPAIAGAAFGGLAGSELFRAVSAIPVGSQSAADLNAFGATGAGDTTSASDTPATGPGDDEVPFGDPSISWVPSASLVASAAPALPARVTASPLAHATVRVIAHPVELVSGSTRQIAESLAAARGWGSSQWLCLSDLWQRESMFRTTARNSRSGAYGIPQAYPASKMATAGADWRTDPVTQIRWGLGYIAQRYGNPCNAWAHWRRARSY